MTVEALARYRRVQDAARATLDQITQFIKPGHSEIDILQQCDLLQRAAGVDGYWYKSLPGVVLSGKHTCLALSREAYVPCSAPIQESDLLTIDLNPAIGGYCGDCARSYYIEGGQVRRAPQRNQEFLAGAHAQEQLHALLRRVAEPDLSFGDLYQVIHQEIERLGFEQLDFLGHGVQEDMSKLEFVGPGVTRTLGEAGLFTLEPQIRLKDGCYGFKHENIYFFEGRELREL